MEKIQLTQFDGTSFDDFVLGSMPDVIFGVDGKPFIILIVYTSNGSTIFPALPENVAALGLSERMPNLEAELLKLNQLKGKSLARRLYRLTGATG